MLILIDEYVTQEDLQLLADWRNKNNFAYKHKVVATPDSIRSWLDNHYFNKPRMLFWVVYEGKKIGTMGYTFKVSAYGIFGAEIDSCMRGTDDGPGQMGVHLESLLALGARMDSYLSITLRVIKGNSHAINFYRKHKFVEYKKDDDYIYMVYCG